MPSNFSPALGEFPALPVGTSFFHAVLVPSRVKTEAVLPSGRCEEGDPCHSLGVIIHVRYPRSHSTAIFGRVWIAVPVTMTTGCYDVGSIKQGWIELYQSEMRLTSSACGAVMEYVRLLWPGKSRLLVNQRLIRGKYLNCFAGYQVEVLAFVGEFRGCLDGPIESSSTVCAIVSGC